MPRRREGLEDDGDDFSTMAPMSSRTSGFIKTSNNSNYNNSDDDDDDDDEEKNNQTPPTSERNSKTDNGAAFLPEKQSKKIKQNDDHKKEKPEKERGTHRQRRELRQNVDSDEDYDDYDDTITIGTRPGAYQVGGRASSDDNDNRTIQYSAIVTPDDLVTTYQMQDDDNNGDPAEYDQEGQDDADADKPVEAECAPKAVEGNVEPYSTTFAWKCFAIFAVVAAVLSVVVAVIVLVVAPGRDPAPPTPPTTDESPVTPTPTPTGVPPPIASPTLAPATPFSIAMDRAMSTLSSSFPDFPASPLQEQTFQWLLENTTIEDLMTSNEEEEHALLDRYVSALFFYSLNGAEWSRAGLWLSERSVCDWQGILCNPDGSQVVRISLDLNSLGGTIPSELGTLTALTYLSLARNGLTGTIPSELGNMWSLASLQLNDNNLSGNIPSRLENLLWSLSFCELGENPNLTGVPNYCT